MKSVWGWIIAIIAGLAVLGLIFSASKPERQAYSIARGAIEERVEISQERIDTAVEMATKAVDVALRLSGDLPSQQAKADLIKQDIEEIGKRLDEAAEARGELAIDKLDQSIDQFNTVLEIVEDAAAEAESPAEKAILDRLYGVLLATKEQLIQTILKLDE